MLYAYYACALWYEAGSVSTHPHATAQPEGAYAHAITHVQGMVTACSWNT